MKVKDSLHELIHSLSKSEKRYYKLYASRHVSSEDSTMLVLFNYIVRQPAYDEEALFRDFKGKALLNQFSTIKKRLYDQILQSLHAFHANNSVENQLNRMLHQAGLLYEKSLYDQCERHLRSAEKLALKHELFLALVNINKLRNKIIETRGYASDEQSIANLSKSTGTALSRERLQADLWDLKTQLFRIVQRNGSSCTPEDQQRIDNLMSRLPGEELLHNFASLESWYLYFHIHAVYHFARAEWTESLHYTEQTIQHLQQHTHFGEAHPNRLLSALTNACYLCEQTGSSDKTRHYLNLITQLDRQISEHASEDLLIKLFSSKYSIETNLLNKSGQFESCSGLTEHILDKLEDMQEKITPVRRAYLLLQLSIAWFGTGNYKKALHQLNLILNDTRLDQKDPIMASTYLFNFLIHLELHNDDHLPYAIRQAKQALKSCNRFTGAEEILLHQLAQLPKLHRIDHEEIYEELEKSLHAKHADYDFSAAHNFDYSAWVQSKVKGSTLAAILQEKYRPQKTST